MENNPKISRRYRVSVPPMDTSVIEWLDKQFSVSQSIRMLIKDSIEKNGMVDIACEPVKKLPKRGRPVKEEKPIIEEEDIDLEFVEKEEPKITKLDETINPGSAEDMMADIMRMGR